MAYSSNLEECPRDTFVWVICDNYKRYDVAKLCSYCGMWSNEFGEPVEDVTDWQPYVSPSADREHRLIDRKISNWLDKNYDIQHKLNSLHKHLGVYDVKLCKNLTEKIRYLEYLESKETQDDASNEVEIKLKGTVSEATYDSNYFCLHTPNMDAPIAYYDIAPATAETIRKLIKAQKEKS